jgi:hypothetical protein
MSTIASNSYKLYQLKTETERILNEIEENYGEIDSTQEYVLEMNAEEAKEVFIDLVKQLQYLENVISLTDNEIKRLTDLKKRRQKTLETIEKILLENLKVYGKENKEIYSMDLVLHKISTRKSTVVEVNSLDALPNNLVNIEFVLDFTKENYDSNLKKLIEAGYIPKLSEFTVNKAEIKKAISEDTAKIETKTDITSEKVLGAKIIKKSNLVIK